MSRTRARPASLAERFERWLVRSFVWTTKARSTPPPGPVPEVPTRSAARPTPLRVAMAAVAIAAPVAAALVLIPLRSTITAPTAALVMVLPVVGVAVLVPPTTSLLAAVSAALAFDLLLTQPYYSLSIDATGDAEAAVVLAVIGLIVATVVTRELESRSRAVSRAREITAVQEAIRALGDPDPDRLPDVVTRQLIDLLDLRGCDWAPGFHGRVGHELARDGSIDRWPGAELPDAIVEVPVVFAGNELGRLLLRRGTPRPVSAEERGTVLVLATLLAHGLGGRASPEA